MRASQIACLFLILAGSASAEDRYGPQNPARAAPIVYAPVALLSWHGKVQPSVPEAAATPELAPYPLSDGALRYTSAYEPAPAPVARAAPAAPPLAVANAAPPPAENAPWRRLTGVSAAPVAIQPQAQMAATAPIAAPGPAPRAAASGEQARFYSLHREYGETPDAIPAPDKNQVFLAGGPLASGVGEGDEAIDSEGTGRTAAINKARLAADWGSSTAK